MTMNDTWGFKTKDHHWKTTATLIRNLVDIASKGGNYLLNVGPTADGAFPQPIVDRLQAIGAWTRVNGEAIYGTTASPFTILPWGRATKKTAGNTTTLYLHVFSWPKERVLLVPGLKNKVTNASLLATGAALKTTATSEGIRISVPAQAPDKIASVIKLTVTGPLTIEPYTIKQQRDGTLQLLAGEATMHHGKDGSSANVEGDEDNRNIGYWTSNQSWVSWNVQISKPGTYTIKALAGTPATTTSFYVQLGTAALAATLNSTGDYNNYREVSLGVIKVEKAGTYILSIKPDAQDWKAMNVRKIILIP
jgi:alpha-L-fucosidase